jgi:hypothetical protein
MGAQILDLFNKEKAVEVLRLLPIFLDISQPK